MHPNDGDWLCRVPCVSFLKYGEDGEEGGSARIGEKQEQGSEVRAESPLGEDLGRPLSSNDPIGSPEQKLHSRINYSNSLPVIL